MWLGENRKKGTCLYNNWWLTVHCLAMLIAMLVVWAHADGAPVYPSMEEEQTIAYVFTSIYRLEFEWPNLIIM